MLRRIGLTGVLATLLLASPAISEPREFTAAGKWKQDASGIKLPESIGAARRGRMVEYDGPANVSAAYDDAATSTAFTIYLYRSASGSVPVWFNEAHKAIRANDALGKMSTDSGIHAFVPPGRNAASGLIETIAIEHNGQSTGLAMFEANGYLVKLRATSARLDRSQLEMAMTTLLAGIAWPKPLQGDLALQPIQDCPAAMATGEAAVRPASMVAVLISSSGAQVVAEKTGTPPVYCRDPLNMPLDAYRPSGATDRYLLPLGDSGVALAAGRDEMMAIMAKADPKSGEAGYWVQFYSANEIIGVEHFASLPSPAQAAKAFEGSTPYYRITSRGKKSEIAISAERTPSE